MGRQHKYGIKFPFTSNDIDGSFLDLNNSESDRIKSELLHIILTPKGQKLRDPDFGTNIAKFIFDPNDSLTHDAIREEITSQVLKYIPNIEFKDFSVHQKDDMSNEIILMIKYGVKINNNETEITTVAVKL
jgi:phage baseplate assembly protein W